MEKSLGKIENVHFGFGGYQDAMFGASFTLKSESGSCQDFWGFWGGERDEHAKWTEKERITFFGNLDIKISKLLEDAKVSDFYKLKGVPIEVILDGMKLSSWRILTEVL